MIEKVSQVTVELIGKEQGAFRNGRGCIDQIKGRVSVETLKVKFLDYNGFTKI